MNDTQLLAKASKAAYDYQKLYGKFPDKIGVHFQRSVTLPYFLYFPIMPRISCLSLETLESAQNITIERHEVRIEPVLDVGIFWDDVFLLIPGGEQKAVNCEFVAKMAK